MSAELTVTVHGIPAPQGSKRHVGGGRMVEASKAVGPWREAVRHETQQAIAAGADTHPTGPISVAVTFRMPRPRGHYRTNGQVRDTAPAFYVATRPDLDKLVRAVLDGLTAGGAFGDDAQVADLIATKHYADVDPPGCHIHIQQAI